MKLRKVFLDLFIIGICILVLISNQVVGLILILLTYVSFKNIYIGFQKKSTINIFNARNQFILHFFLIHGIGYYAYLVRKSLLLNNYTFTDETISFGLILAIIGVIVYNLSYKFMYNKIDSGSMAFTSLQIKKIYSSPTYKWIVLIILILGFTVLFWKMMGTIPFFTPNYNSEARAELGKGLGYLEALNFSLINISLILFINIVRKKKFHWNYVTIFLIIFSIYILNSDRGGLLYFLLSMWFVYSIYNGQPNLKVFTWAAAGIVILAGLMGVMKSSDRSNILLSGTIILTEVAVEFDNYNEVFNMVENDGYLGGSTLIPLITLPIPRSILPSKDEYLTAGNYFKEYHNHHHIRVGERMGYLGEFYLNFGIPGIIIGMMIIGFFAAFLDKGVNLKSSISVYLYIQLTTMVSSVGGDIPTAFISFIMKNILPLTFLAVTYLYIYTNHGLYRHNLRRG